MAGILLLEVIMVHYGGCLISRIRKVRWQDGLKFYQLMIWRFSIDRGDCIQMLMHCLDAHVYILNNGVQTDIRNCDFSGSLLEIALRN